MLLFAASAFPIHLWAIYNLLQVLPAWLLRMSTWEVVGGIAYTLAFALLESILITAGLWIVAMLLPARWIKGRFVAIGSSFIFLNALWTILLHYEYQTVRSMGVRELLPWLALYAFSVLVVLWFVYRSEKLSSAIVSLIERLAVLSFFYIAMDVLGLMVVVVRNL